MKLRTAIPIVFGLGLVTAVAFAKHGSPVGTEPGWYSDLAKAKAASKKSGKVMMIDFNATWCGPCQMYKRDVFPGAEFKKATKDMILVDIDVDQHPDLAKLYRIDGIPDIRIYAPSGKQIEGIVGFSKPQLLAKIEHAKKLAK